MTGKNADHSDRRIMAVRLRISVGGRWRDEGERRLVGRLPGRKYSGTRGFSTAQIAMEEDDDVKHRNWGTLAIGKDKLNQYLTLLTPGFSFAPWLAAGLKATARSGSSAICCRCRVKYTCPLIQRPEGQPVCHPGEYRKAGEDGFDVRIGS